MKITVPAFSLIALIGVSSSGKSTFARRHFRPTEIVSSDAIRAMIADDENDQAVNAATFDLLHRIVGKRLAYGKLTVVDATNTTARGRKPLVALARKHNAAPVAVVLNVHPSIAYERHESRPDRDFSADILDQHLRQLRRALPRLEREGFTHIFILNTQEDVDVVEIILNK